MSVAEQTTLAKPTRPAQPQLAVASFGGALFLLAGLLLIFGGLPTLWANVFPQEIVNEFLSSTLLIAVSLLALVGFGFLCFKLEAAFNQRALRPGVVLASLAIFFSLWIGFRLGDFLESRDVAGVVGLAISFGIAVGLLIVAFRVFSGAGFQDWLGSLEDQGWFHAIHFKPNQGVRVRRGTVLGILAIGISGLITMVSHRALGSDRFGPNDWYWTIPFTSSSTAGLTVENAGGDSGAKIVSIDADADDKTLLPGDIIERVKDETVEAKEKVIANAGQWRDYVSTVKRPKWVTLVVNRDGQTLEAPTAISTQSLTVPILYKVHLIVPIVLAIALLWFAWRVVNWPAFADFLIATEAEMNKVSWTTRKRLVQDTIVVLVTVFLLTVFLFVIDILWVRILTAPFIRVLYVDFKAEQLKQQEKTQW